MFTEAHKDMAMMVAERVLALAGDPLPFFLSHTGATIGGYADAAWQAHSDGAQLTPEEQHLVLYDIEQITADDLNDFARHGIGGVR